jgi:hypothetical protein
MIFSENIYRNVNIINTEIDYINKNNLLHLDDRETYTKNGIDITVNNGVIHMEGTSTARCDIEFDFTPLKTGYYWLSGIPTGGGTTKYYAFIYPTTDYDVGAGMDYYLTEGTTYRIWITVPNGKTVNIDIPLSLESRVYTPEEIENALNANPFKYKKYYDHLFIDTVNRGGAAYIPCQSQYHIPISKRLGFEVIEINVCKTSDNNYVIMHGVQNAQGKMAFGGGMYSLDQTDITELAVSDVTLDYIKTNVRYHTRYNKYNVSPMELSEGLRECIRYGLTPLVYCGFGDQNEIDIIESICGQNYIAYDGNRKQNKSSLIMKWKNAATPKQALNICHSVGLPAMLCLSNASSLTDTQIKNIAEACHAEGYLVGFAASYVTAPIAQKLFALGLDYAASGHELNPTESKLDTYLPCYISFEGLITTGTISDNNLVLAQNDTIELSDTLENSFLKAAYLELTFIGDINISFGSHISDVNFTAPTETKLVLSTCDFVTALNFTITANTETTIKELVFKNGEI